VTDIDRRRQCKNVFMLRDLKVNGLGIPQDWYRFPTDFSTKRKQTIEENRREYSGVLLSSMGLDSKEQT
jgi:hypothetical protein